MDQRNVAISKEEQTVYEIAQNGPTGWIFFPLVAINESVKEYDEFSHLTKRQYVLPNFAEIRHILNIAQVHVSAKNVRLVTLMLMERCIKTGNTSKTTIK